MAQKTSIGISSGTTGWFGNSIDRGTLSDEFCKLVRRGLSALDPRSTEDFLHIVFVAAALSRGATVGLCEDPFFVLFRFPDQSHARLTLTEVRANYEPTFMELETKPEHDPVRDVLELLLALSRVERGRSLGPGHVLRLSRGYGIC